MIYLTKPLFTKQYVFIYIFALCILSLRLKKNIYILMNFLETWAQYHINNKKSTINFFYHIGRNQLIWRLEITYRFSFKLVSTIFIYFTKRGSLKHEKHYLFNWKNSFGFWDVQIFVFPFYSHCSLHIFPLQSTAEAFVDGTYCGGKIVLTAFMLIFG